MWFETQLCCELFTTNTYIMQFTVSLLSEKITPEQTKTIISGVRNTWLVRAESLSAPCDITAGSKCMPY